MLTAAGLSPRATRAHALKNCLTVVDAVNRLVEREASDLSRERLQRSQEAVHRMLALIADDLGPKSATRPLPDSFVTAEEVANAVVARVGDRAEAAYVELFVQCGPGGVRGDADALTEAFSNFVLNAIEATAPGGAVFIATYESPDGSQHWTVQDTGPGIPPEMVERIGMPFSTGREEGFALGVAVARDVVQGHGGRTSIESRSGAGTLISIWLPPAEPVLHNRVSQRPCA